MAGGGVDSSSSSAASGTVAVALLLCTPLAQSTTNPVWALRTSLHVKTGRTKLKTARLWTDPVSCSVQVDAPTVPPQSAGTSAGEAVAEQVCESAIEPGP